MLSKKAIIPILVIYHEGLDTFLSMIQLKKQCASPGMLESGKSTSTRESAVLVK